MWFYQRVDLLHFGHCPYLEADSSVVQTEYFYTDIWCDWILKSSKDKEILCNRILNGSQDTDICVSGHQTDHRTDYWIQWTNLTVSYRGQVRLVHYCVIVYTVESIPFDCYHCF